MGLVDNLLVLGFLLGQQVLSSSSSSSSSSSVPDIDLSWRRASFGNILPVHFSLRSFLGLRITSLVCFWFHHDPQRFYSVGDRKSLSTVNRDLNFKSLLFCSASSLSTP